MNDYSVKIYDHTATDGLLGSPYLVVVYREPRRDSIGMRRYMIARTSGIQTRERAEQVALDYRAQFGVQS